MRVIGEKMNETKKNILSYGKEEWENVTM